MRIHTLHLQLISVLQHVLNGNSCEEPSSDIAGCMDANASNFDSTATQQSVDSYGNLLCLYASCDDIPEYGCIYADSYSPFTADFGAAACSEWGTHVRNHLQI